jgi:hypothetical protein
LVEAEIGRELEEALSTPIADHFLKRRPNGLARSACPKGSRGLMDHVKVKVNRRALTHG